MQTNEERARPNPASAGRRGIRIFRREILLSHYFLQVEEFEFAYRLPDGQWSEPTRRISVDRGQSVAALIYERKTDSLLFTWQFRFSTYDFERENESANGWILEIVAGRTVSAETPEQTMAREIGEELGVGTVSMLPVSEFYLTPGASSEKMILYFSETDADADAAIGGVDDEYIELVRLPVRKCFEELDRGAIHDAKTIIALQWLRANIDVLARRTA